MRYFLTILYHLLNGEMKINVTERLPEGSNILTLDKDSYTSSVQTISLQDF